MTIPKPERTPPKARKRIARTSKPLKRARIAKRPRASRKKAVLYADSLWSQIVRRREGGCVDPRPHKCAGCFQAAHGFSRRYYGTRWNLQNGFKLCAGAPVYYTHRPLEWDDHLRRTFGVFYEDMRAAALSVQAKQDLPQITAALEAVLHTGGIA